MCTRRYPTVSTLINTGTVPPTTYPAQRVMQQNTLRKRKPLLCLLACKSNITHNGPERIVSYVKCERQSNIWYETSTIHVTYRVFLWMWLRSVFTGKVGGGGGGERLWKTFISPSSSILRKRILATRITFSAVFLRTHARRLIVKTVRRKHISPMIWPHDIFVYN